MTRMEFDKVLALTAASTTASLETAALQTATPIVLALAECDDELRAEAVELFKQLASDELDKEQRFATTALIAEILFPNCDDDGAPGMDLAKAEELAPLANPESKGILDQMDQDEAIFAERLSELMDEKGLDQTELAELVGIGQPAISMMLKRTSRPQRKTVLRFAKALGVAAEDLWPPLRASAQK